MTARRHAADVTADRLDSHYDQYQDRLSAKNLANMADTIDALRRIAVDDRRYKRWLDKIKDDKGST